MLYPEVKPTMARREREKFKGTGSQSKEVRQDTFAHHDEQRNKTEMQLQL